MAGRRLGLGIGLAAGLGIGLALVVLAVAIAGHTSQTIQTTAAATQTPTAATTKLGDIPVADRSGQTPPTAATATPWPIGAKPTIQQEAALWAVTDAALVRFVGQGASNPVGGPTSKPTSCDLQRYHRALDDFARGLTNLKNVVAPADWAKLHKALLPLYDEMDRTMRAIVAAFQIGDEATVEVEWEHLRLLLDEVATTARIVQPQGTSAAPTRTTTSTIAPAVAPSQGERVLFRDDFTDPGSGFPKSSSNPDVSEIGYCDRHYQLRLLTTPRAANAWRTRDGFEDFALEVDADLVEAKPNGSYGLLFRQRDAENYYQFSVDPNVRQYGLSRVQNNQQQGLRNWSGSEAIQRGTGRNRLKVVAKGDTISAFVNGILLTTVQDGTYRSGHIGLFINAWSEPITARFYNLIVTAADASPLP